MFHPIPFNTIQKSNLVKLKEKKKWQDESMTTYMSDASSLWYKMLHLLPLIAGTNMQELKANFARTLMLIFLYDKTEKVQSTDFNRLFIIYA